MSNLIEFNSNSPTRIITFPDDVVGREQWVTITSAAINGQHDQTAVLKSRVAYPTREDWQNIFAALPVSFHDLSKKRGNAMRTDIDKLLALNKLIDAIKGEEPHEQCILTPDSEIELPDQGKLVYTGRVNNNQSRRKGNKLKWQLAFDQQEKGEPELHMIKSCERATERKQEQWKRALHEMKD